MINRIMTLIGLVSVTLASLWAGQYYAFSTEPMQTHEVTSVPVNVSNSDATGTSDSERSVLVEIIWDHDGTKGASLSHPIRFGEFAENKVPRQLKVTVRMSDAVAEHWEIDHVAAFRVRTDDRVRTTYQGPFEWTDYATTDPPDSSIWMLRELSNDAFDFEVYLHRKKDGMTLKELQTAIQQRNAVNFQVKPF